MFVLILLAGCQKEKDTQPKTNEYYVTTQPIEELIGLDKRTSETEFDKMLFWSAKSILNLYQNDNNMLSDIVTQVANSEDNCIPFSDLSENYLQAINDYLGREYKVNLRYIINHMIFDSIPYYPIIGIANVETCNPNLNPIIVIGTETYLDSTFNNQGDFIAGWGITNNNINTILINEQQANNTARPIIIINDATDYVKSCDAGAVSTGVVSGHGGNGGSGGGGGSSTYKHFIITKFKIDYRYEQSGKSEYYLTYNISAAGSGYKQPDFIIRKVKKSEIGTDIPIYTNLRFTKLADNGSLIDANFEKNVDYKLFGVTYEYDWWYLSHHDIIFSNGMVFKCKMKFANEYYQIIAIPLDMNNYTYKQVTGKGYIRITRHD